MLLLTTLGITAAAARPSARSANTALVYQAPATLPRGGEMAVVRARLGGGGTLLENRAFSIGWDLNVAVSDYRFDRGAGQPPPWGEVCQADAGLAILHPLEHHWLLMVVPTLGLAGESDAAVDRCLGYGALASLSWQGSEQLRLGFGGGLYRNLDKTEAFPVLLIDWEFAPGWRLANPLRAGITGPAGLELSWRPRKDWEWGIGGAWRSFRFRLDEEGAAPGGVGEERLVPVWLRGMRSLGALQLAAYAGVALDGELRLDDRHGGRIADDRYATTPFLALYLSGAF